MVKETTFLKKNRDYNLHYIEPESGYGLLYSKKQDKCFFLNTLAATLWKIPTDYVNPKRESQIFAEVSKLPDADDHLLRVISDLTEKNLLISSQQDSKVPETASINSGKQTFNLDQIYLYITKDCNARCYHCYQPTEKWAGNPQQQKQNQVSKNSLLRFVEEAIPLGVQSVKITGGEPLLRVDLIDIIKELRKLNIRVSMETNAFLIDEKIADSLVEHDVRISISLDGGSPKAHDSLRNLPGSFDRVINALDLLSERGSNPQIIIAVSRRNLKEVERVLRIASEHNSILVKINPVNTLGIAQRLKKDNILLDVDEILTLYKKRGPMQSKYGLPIYIEGPPSFSSLLEIAEGHCIICPFTNILGVLSDGSISFCGVGNSYPELVFGNIDDENFDVHSFWQGTNGLLSKVRQSLSHRIKGVCEKCLFESFCKGSCRALAYGEKEVNLMPAKVETIHREFEELYQKHGEQVAEDLEKKSRAVMDLLVRVRCATGEVCHGGDVFGGKGGSGGEPSGGGPSGEGP
jgi:SynChlorMet cassette radical SAM/SPASM protein ScmF